RQVPDETGEAGTSTAAAEIAQAAEVGQARVGTAATLAGAGEQAVEAGTGTAAAVAQVPGRRLGNLPFIRVTLPERVARHVFDGGGAYWEGLDPFRNWFGGYINLTTGELTTFYPLPKAPDTRRLAGNPWNEPATAAAALEAYKARKAAQLQVDREARARTGHA